MVGLGVLVWTTSVAAAGGWADTSLAAFFYVSAAALLVHVSAALWEQRRHVGTPFMLTQLALDVLLVSALAWLTGGRVSYLILLYFPTIAAGAYLLGLRGAVSTATMASFGFIAAVGLHGDLSATTAEAALVLYSETMFRVFAFFLLGLLTGQLAEAAARTAGELTAERRSARVLAVEHGTVLDRVRAGVLTTDGDDRVLTVNPFARGLLGDVDGRSIIEVFPCFVATSTWEETTGGRRWICSAAALPNGGHVVLVDDVTEIQRMRERAARDERLVAAGRLAASLAHEIRNPLASLSGALQLIAEEHGSRLAEMALHEAARLNRLVDDFLNLSRRTELRPVDVDLAAIAAEVCAAFGRDPRYAQQARVRFEGGPTRLVADPDRVRQLLWNLVINAAQSMPRGGEIVVRATTTRDGAELRVADEGTGIPEAERERIFDPFFTTRSGGTGLGLAVVEQVVRAHGGGVRVTGRPAGGTEFIIDLPRSPTSEEDIRA